MFPKHKKTLRRWKPTSPTSSTTTRLQQQKTPEFCPGGLTLLNSILQLYLENAVVEEYDDEGWHIKKYANGYAECFGRVNVGQVTLGTQLGTDVVSNVIRIAFPITFEELPEYCSVTYEGNGTGYATLQSPGVSQLSTTHAYSVRLCRIGAQSTVLANNIFNVHVLGKYQ